MVNNSEDTNRNIRTILFMVLFSLLLLSAQDLQENTPSRRDTAQTELFSGGLSNLQSTFQCSPFSLPDLNQFCEYAPRHTDLIPFSIPNKILDYNRKIAQSFIVMQNTRLSIETIPQLRYYTHLLSATDDDIPDLS